MKLHTRLVLVTSVLVLAILVWFFSAVFFEARNSVPPPLGVSPAELETQNLANPAPTVEALKNSMVQERILRTFSVLKGTFGPEQKMGSVIDLLKSLGAGKKTGIGLAAILAFLDNGEDAPTGMEFQLNPNGSLASAPTLRTALLDLLWDLDKAEASKYADKIFERSQVPDEWALALRDRGRFLGRAEAASTAAYTLRVEQLLARREWLDNPSMGFLHAFDSAVFVGTKGVIQKLVAAHDENHHQAVTYASRLALDRLAMQNFPATASVIVSNPAHLSTDPLDRATIMSRADPVSAMDSGMVVSYLNDPAIGVEEKRFFLQSFPNGNLELSNNLMTQNPFIPMLALARRDDAALALMNVWHGDAALHELQPALEERVKILTEFAATRAFDR